MSNVGNPPSIPSIKHDQQHQPSSEPSSSVKQPQSLSSVLSMKQQPASSSKESMQKQQKSSSKTSKKKQQPPCSKPVEKHNPASVVSINKYQSSSVSQPQVTTDSVLSHLLLTKPSHNQSSPDMPFLNQTSLHKPSSNPPSPDQPSSNPPSLNSPSPDQPSSSPPSLNLPPLDQLSSNRPSLDQSAPSSSESSLKQSTVLVSDSPVKSDPNLWLPQLQLYIRDKRIIESSFEWLTDSIICAAQFLLKQQSKQKISGWMNTQLVKRKQLFLPVPPNARFIQILHVDGSHWITVSNIDINNDSVYSDAVTIYDSGFPANVAVITKKAICSIMKPKADMLRFDLANLQVQPNGSDCGLFAIASATELVHGCDPVLCHWDNEKMRQHLLCCLENGYISRFPCTKRRRVPLGSRIKKSVCEEIFCRCRTINDKRRPMISCDACLKYFHMDCEELDTNKCYKGIKWICSSCTIIAS